MVALSSDCKPSTTAADNDDIFFEFQSRTKLVETLCFNGLFFLSFLTDFQKENEALFLSPPPSNVVPLFERVNL